MATFLLDLRVALRTLVRNPGFATLTLLALAVGIGATTGTVSVIESVLLRQLPYREPERLCVVREIVPQWSHLYASLPANAAHFLEWQSRSSSFEQLAAIRPLTLILSEGTTAEQVDAARVSANLFSLLGVQPQLGRSFKEEENEPGRDFVVVITASLWKRRFGADPSLVGRAIKLNNQLYVVVGILPESFYLPKNDELGSFVPLAPRTEIFKPIGVRAAGLRPVGSHDYAVIGRLKRDVTAQQASTELNAVQADIAKRLPEKLDLRILLAPLSDQIVGRVQEALWLLLAAAGALLLIICANLATILLARTAERSSEIALRQALGASRFQLAKLMLVEALVLSLAGGMLGILVAAWSLDVLVKSAPVNLPRVEGVQLNAPVLGCSLFLIFLTSILLGGLPAWHWATTTPHAALRARGPTATEGPRWARMRKILVTLEVALSTILLVAGGLLLHSFVRLMRVDKGFEGRSVLAVEVALPAYRYREHAQRFEFYRRALEQISSLPGVKSVGLASALPVEGEAEVDTVAPEGDTRPESERPLANFRYVSQGYFLTLGIPFLRGQVFKEGDRQTLGQGQALQACPRCGEASDEIVVSEVTARALWPGEDPIGKRVHAGNLTKPTEVVGLVGNVRVNLDKSPGLMVYLPYGVVSPLRGALILRSATDPRQLIAAVRMEIGKLDPEVPVLRARTMDEIQSAALAGRRYQMLLIQVFAGVALLVASCGMYGVVSFFVARRTNEIGIRMAMGALPSAIRTMVLRQGLAPIIVGLSVGVFGALAVGRLLRSLLFEVRVMDGLTLGLVVVLQMCVGALACLVPAMRAARLDPMSALRYE